MPFDMDFSNDGALLACATTSDDQAAAAVRVLRSADGSLVTTFMQSSVTSARGIAFVEGGHQLVFLFQREDDSTQLLRASLESRDPTPLRRYDASARNHSIIRDRTGARFAVLGNQIEVWDVVSGNVLATIVGDDKDFAVQATFSADGSHIYAYGVERGAVVKYDLQAGRQVARWAAPTDFGAQVLVTPDERFLVAAGASYKGVFIYDLFAGQRLMSDADDVAQFNERTLCTPWVTALDSSLVCCLKLSPWCFRLPTLSRLSSTQDVAPGARCLAATWAQEAPMIAFGTLEDATVRLFSLVQEPVL
ncbi:MAG: WD40 repeat domain-containing protein [Myxococcales bacterium]|nr:WD40 repeat domain-containing protein [Myxococcales bacterium]